jgi:chromosome segregation ATPase
MGFSDLLTSSRGPGVIGTLVALLVLVGFGTLYVFVFDEGLQGGQKTIESVIRDQAGDIDNIKIQIENAKKRIEEADIAKAKAREANGLATRNAALVKQIEELTAAKAAAAEEITKAGEAWEAYKDEYRKSEWASAVGDKMDDVKTPSGQVFTGVEVKGVDHTGVRISHSAGSKTIAPEDLPPDLYDRFQFDMAKKKAVEKAKDTVEGSLHNDVELTNLFTSNQEKQAKIDGFNQEIATLGAAVEKAKEADPRYQMAMTNKRAQIAAEKAKIGGVSRAPAMQDELKAMEKAARESSDSIPVNERKISTAQGEISKLQGEIRDNKAKIEEIKKKAQPASSKN